jgi:hypothetical protein
LRGACVEHEHALVRWLREPIFVDLLRIIVVSVAVLVGIAAWQHL